MGGKHASQTYAELNVLVGHQVCTRALALPALSCDAQTQTTADNYAPPRKLALKHSHHKMNRLIIVAALLVAACASPVVYKDPQTGHTAQCSSSNLGPLPAARHDIDDCSTMLEHLGWVRE